MEEIGIRAIEYPKAIGRGIWRLLKWIGSTLWFLVRTLIHFGVAAWSGKVFPLSPGGRIFDQGEPIGWLGGGIPQLIGRIMALPIVSLVTIGNRLGVASTFVYLVPAAQIGIWLGLLEEAVGNFIYIFYTASGTLAIGAMIYIPVMFWTKKADGLRTIFIDEKKPKPEKPEPEVRRHDDTLVKQIRDSLSDMAENLADNLAANITAKIGDVISSLIPWRWRR